MVIKLEPLRSLSTFLRRRVEPLFVRSGKYERKIDLSDQLVADFGRHRSGLKYGLRYLRVLQNPKGSVLDAFVERTFIWNGAGVKSHLRPWIGFIHVPPHVPEWFHSEHSNDVLIASGAWKESLPYCRGLFAMSAYHKKHLEKKLDVPVDSLHLPTETPRIKWSWGEFQSNRQKKIVQVGWWLRKLHAIYQLPRCDYGKIFLSVEHPSLPHLIAKERELLISEGTFTWDMYDTVETCSFLSNEEYDRLLSRNIVFFYLYDASASNAIIECIARNTPLLVNPIEPVQEYLGSDYPFYYQSLEEAVSKAMDFDLVYRTHQFLVNHPDKEKLSGRYFLDSFANSEIYRDLQLV